MAAVSTCKKLREKLLGSGDRPIKERTTNRTWGALQGGQDMMGALHVEMRHLLRTNQIDIAEDECSKNQQSSNEKNSEQKDEPAKQEKAPKKDESDKKESVSKKDNSTTKTPNTEKTPNFQKKSASPKKQNHRPQKGLFFGDSMTYGVKLELFGGDFNTVTVSGGRLCPRPNSTDNQTNMNKRLQSVMTGEEEHVGLHIGINDTIGCDIDKFDNRYRSLIQTAQSGGAHVYCSGIFHTGNAPGYAARLARNRLIDELNDVIKSVAEDYGCTFIDNCAEVESVAHKPNLNILTTPAHGAKLLHLTEPAKLDFKYRIEDHICMVQQRAYPTPPRPRKQGRRISKPQSRSGYRRTAPSPPYPYRDVHAYGGYYDTGRYMGGYSLDDQYFVTCHTTDSVELTGA